jgi:hypothetical protein
MAAAPPYNNPKVLSMMNLITTKLSDFAQIPRTKQETDSFLCNMSFEMSQTYSGDDLNLLKEAIQLSQQQIQNILSKSSLPCHE